LALASMGIYVFDTDFLSEKLIEDAANPDSAHDFGRNIVPESIERQERVYAYPFRDVVTKAQSYWRDVGTIDGFYKSNLELTHVSPELNLYDEAWPIWTYQEQLPPAKFILDGPGRSGMALNSLISGGCIVSGAEIRDSILFSNVHVQQGSRLTRTLALPRASIGANCRISQAIIDEDCAIPDGCVIGEDPEEDARRYHHTEEGVVLVCPHMLHWEEAWEPAICVRRAGCWSGAPPACCCIPRRCRAAISAPRSSFSISCTRRPAGCGRCCRSGPPARTARPTARRRCSRATRSSCPRAPAGRPRARRS